MVQPVTRIAARNFRSLANVDVQLGPLNVLIGPNGSGKTNLLRTLQFLATTNRLDLTAAFARWGGFEHLQRQDAKPAAVQLTVEGMVTPHSSPTAHDEYSLTLRPGRSGVLRSEDFTYKRFGGRGRRIKVSGRKVHILDESGEEVTRTLADNQTTGLATLPKFSDEEGGQGIRDFARFLSSIRVLEPDVEAARQPVREVYASLAEDASNLAAALARLRLRDSDAWALLKHDMSRCLPGLLDLELASIGGSGRAVVVQLIESGITQPIELADASFGTVRLLALLAALHEPDPPSFTAIEEVDHGLHPYAMDILIDRMRAASVRTQILAATHSPTLVNRLAPSEIVVCDRDADTGASLIPAKSVAEIAAAVGASDWRPGELWFAGALAGVPA